MVKSVTDYSCVFVVPFLIAWILDLLLRKVIHLYPNDIFKFMG